LSVIKFAAGHNYYKKPGVAGMADSWRQVNLLGGQDQRMKLGVR